jgi:copper transport protein
MRRGLLAGVVVIVALVPARPAAAHAVLRASEPLDRQVLAEAPERVVLRFSEAVAVSRSSVRVLDHHGDTVVGRGARHVPGDDSQVELALPDLGDGTYVVTWRVVSADSHPAVGAVSFRVGEATDDFHIGASLLEAPGGDPTVGVVFGVVRFALFASVILLVGVGAFVAVVWPEGRRRQGPRRLLVAAWAGVVVSTMASIGLQGAYTSGGGLGRAVSPSVVGDVLRTRYGDAGIARLAVLLGAGAVTLVLRRPPARPPFGPRRATLGPLAVAAAALALLASISWIGHASTGRFRGAALVLDVVHLAAVSVWVGGLVALLAFVLRRPPPEGEHRAGAVAVRFSAVALAAVVAMVATGTLQSWRQLDGVGELTSTTFGRLLVVKVALVAGMLVAGGFSRRAVREALASRSPALSPGPGAEAQSPPDRVGVLRRWVGLEAAGAALVIAVTAGLVNAVPARSAADVTGPALPFSTELAKDGVKLSVTLEPARTGLDDLHVYVISEAGRFASAGRPIDALEVSATLRLAEGDTGPIEVPLVENAPGHWSAFGFPIPIAGTWELEVAALVSDIDLVRVRTDVSIR